MEKLRLAAEAFATQGEPLQLSPCGQGHIHDTYRVRCAGGSYALQRVNTAVFPKPALVMENIVRITEQQKRALGDRAERRVLETVPLKAGGLLLWQDGACYRMFRFLENAYAPERSTPAVAEETGPCLRPVFAPDGGPGPQAAARDLARLPRHPFAPAGPFKRP